MRESALSDDRRALRDQDDADPVLPNLHHEHADLAARGWELETVMTDNGSEFRSRVFGETVAELGASQRFIHAARPQTNGCVERVQGTILEECWKPAFARHLIPKQTGLRRNLERYLRYSNSDRAHTGRWTRRPHPRQRHLKGQGMVLTRSAMCRQISEIRQARRCRVVSRRSPVRTHRGPAARR